MRILHTSDWHLGASYYGQSREKEQRAFLDWLVALIEERAVDALVVAGDVFHQASPGAEAQRLYYGFLARLAGLGGQTQSGGRRKVIVVGGNHDSAQRLDAPRELLGVLDTRVVGGHDAEREAREGSELGDATGVLVPLSGGSGEVELVIAAVPYLHDWHLGVRSFDTPEEQQRDALTRAFAEVYSRLADKAERAFPGVPLVATGHLTCLETRGARPTEEDAIPEEGGIHRVGTLGAMTPAIFDDRYGYVALGHIHRGFAVGRSGRVRYSGTPVQVSAVENPDRREVLLVDLSREGLSVEPVRVPVTRRLLALSGSLPELQAMLASLRVPESEEPPYLCVEARLEAPDPGAAQCLREAAKMGPAVPVLAQLSLTTVRSEDAARDAWDVERPEALTPERALELAWQSRHGGQARPSEEVWQRFRALLEKTRSAEEGTR